MFRIRLLVRRGGAPAASATRQPWAPRPISFFLSAAIHAALITILISEVPWRYLPGYDWKKELAHYKVLPAPDRKRVIYYDFHAKLPRLPPHKEFGKSQQPRGLIFSRDTLITNSPEANAANQTVWRPDSRTRMDREVKAPNLLILKTAPEPVQQPTQTKPFVAPETRPATTVKTPLLADVAPPAPASEHAGMPLPSASSAIEPALKLKPRKFVLETGPSRVPSPALIVEKPPEIVGQASRGGQSAVEALAEERIKAAQGNRPQAKAFIAPAGTSSGSKPGGAGAGPPLLDPAPPSLAQSYSPGDVNLAILGVKPAAALEGALPEGSKSGRISRAPVVGEPASGRLQGQPGPVPDVVSSGASGTNPVTAVTTPALPKPVRRLVLELPAPVPTPLSAPLPPYARTIPGRVEQRLAGRVAYALVIPRPPSPIYTEDWILWFAEREPKQGETPRVRAPWPYKKFETSADPAVVGSVSEGRVQLTAVIRSDGHIDSVATLRDNPGPLGKAGVEDLKKWEFRPATRNGQPIDIDVVFDVALRLQAPVGTQ